MNPDDYPSKEEQRDFLRTYLQVYNSKAAATADANPNQGLGNGASSSSSGTDPRAARSSAGEGQASLSSTPGGGSANNTEEPSEQELKMLQSEVNKFALLSHLSWTIWALYQERVSTIDFDYRDYALGRMGWFYQTKDQMMQG